MIWCSNVQNLPGSLFRVSPIPFDENQPDQDDDQSDELESSVKAASDESGQQGKNGSHISVDNPGDSGRPPKDSRPDQIQPNTAAKDEGMGGV